MAADPRATSVALVVSGGRVYICYVDEAGCTGPLPSANSPIQPAFVIVGLALKHEHITEMTHEFLRFKKQFFPGLTSSCQSYLDCMLTEIKGADLRKLAKKNRNQRRFALGVMEHLVEMLEHYEAKIFGRIWIKPVGGSFDGRAVYTYSMQHIAHSFQQLLATQDTQGVIIADSRAKPANAIVSHSIFTQKFKSGGDSYDRILEMPVFGHSDNHSGLQLTDLLVSAILFPIATSVYCSGYVTDRTHIDPKYLAIRTALGSRLKHLQFRYQDAQGRWLGGLKISDPLGHRNAGSLFD
jgi:hypothetical protein